MMKLAALFFCALAIGADKSTNKEPSVQIQKSSLHVMSFNIKGLPSFALDGDYKDSRYQLIGKLLADRVRAGTAPEIVLLQEGFTEQTRKLIEASGYPHVAQGPGANSLLGVSSGLYILSQHPIVQEASTVFGSSSCLSWDCFANKGVQFARIAIPGSPMPLEVYNTHLQAGRTDSPARQKQVKTLLEFFKKQHKEGSAVIFAGDFNFRPGLGQQSYLDFAKGTGFSHAGKYCLDHGCARSADDGWHGIWERAVDHQFYQKGRDLEIVPLHVERSYRGLVQNERLSDHPAHEVKYELRWSGVTVALEPNAPADPPSLKD